MFRQSRTWFRCQCVGSWVGAALGLRTRQLCLDIFSRLASMSESKPPPPGIYVPAVLFFNEDEELDEEAIESHILHLAQVPKLGIYR